jgi:amidase/6-aminohexanoate-cyclic-dimer hydrolase
VLAGGAALAVGGAAQAREKRMSNGQDQFSQYDAVGLANLVKTREVSPTELLDAAIRRTEETNPKYNFLAREHYDLAHKAIDAGLPQGPLTGVPWLIKDLNTYIEGTVTGQGSRFYKNNVGTVTSEIVRRYQRAGLVIFGKTTTPEFGLTGTTESLATGATRNPWNVEHIAGGSSGGAAAAVAAGVIPAAHATDGGGSIRIPAACCGLFGLKPSRGRTPMGPLRTEGWGGLSIHHAVSRTVRDSAALLDATQGPEPGSRYAAPTPTRPYLEEVGRDPGKLRIALWLTTPGGTPVDPEVLEAARAAAKLAESLGHHVEEAAPKVDAAALGQASFVLMGASVAAELDDRAKAMGVTLSTDLVEPVTLAFREIGAKFAATDWVRGNNALQVAAVELARFMENYDVILSPTIAVVPPRLGTINLAQDFQTFIRNVTPFTPWTGLFNQTGQPSMSVPLGLSNSGLPIGSMFTARYGDEATLFRLAAQLEKAQPWFDRRAAA